MTHLNKNLESGQVGLVTLLLMSVVLSIALSLSLRTIMEQDIALTQDESTRVFNVAESGVEQALNLISTGDEINWDDFAELEVTESSIVDFTLESGRAIEIPLNQTSNTVNLHWWSRTQECSDSPTPAALIISIYDQNNSAKHLGFDPCGRGDLTPIDRNNTPHSPGNGENYYYSTVVNVSNNDVVMRIRPLYFNTQLYITSAAFPDTVQYNIISTGYTGTTMDIARTLEVKRSIDGAPDFMDFALISGSDIIKDLD